ncbi:Troponin T, partial [Lamellibrachia satsuma]
QEQRKKERMEEEMRMAEKRAEEDARRKAEEEERKKKKEEEEQRRKEERASKMAEFEKLKDPQKRNFVISSSRREDATGVKSEDEGGSGEEKKSREQLEAEKKAILAQRITPLNVAGCDSSKLTDKAKELHALIMRLEGEKYDLEKQFKEQQIDMLELAERARSINKVGKGGLKRLTLTDGSDKIQERFAGAPAKIVMFSQFERQKDNRTYVDRRDIFIGPTYVLPPNRINPTKILKWSEDGLPIYE